MSSKYRRRTVLALQPPICLQQIACLLAVRFDFSVERGEALFQSSATQCEDHGVEQTLSLLKMSMM